MLVAWRLAAPEFARTPGDMLSGEGARLYGGRWNSPGRAAVYLGDSLALASMELLVHLDNVAVLRAYRKMPLYIHEELVMHIKPAEMPPKWETGSRNLTKSIGDWWLAQRRSAILQAPSAVVPGESNFIVNPRHPDFPTLKAGPISDFRYDPRLAD